MPKMVRTTYYAFYQACYAPRFQAIDLLLKTMEEPLTLSQAADLLDINKNEALRIVSDETLPEANRHRKAGIDKDTFLFLMTRGASPLCRMYQRELARGVKAFYSPSDIAYIYGLTDGHVRAVCENAGLLTVPARDVPALLDRVPVFILYDTDMR